MTPVFGQDLGHSPAGGYPEAGIKGGKRLIEEHQFGLACQRAGKGHPLLLPAGKLVRAALCHFRIQGHHLQQFTHPAGDAAAAFGELRRIQSKRHVLGHRQVREECPVLRHIADLPLMRRHPDTIAGHRAAVQRDAAGQRVLEARYQPQERGFARSGGTNDCRGSALGHRKVHPPQDVLRAEVLGDTRDLQVRVGAGCHGRGDPWLRQP
ncbi:hypothetical protein QF038_003491 [Pseudarthrobacter sp. W1I19]|nr:hypothetical protein [Pseudarthrobacter sp. W1I19]